MHRSILALFLTIWVAFVSGFNGIATFNNYYAQVNDNQPVACHNEDFGDGPNGSFYAAAYGDQSPNLSPGNCTYTDKEKAQDKNFWWWALTQLGIHSCWFDWTEHGVARCLVRTAECLILVCIKAHLVLKTDAVLAIRLPIPLQAVQA